jgi:S1-C subfamily serine protease
MKLRTALLAVLVTALWLAPPAAAQTIGEIFKQVSDSVVVIRTEEKALTTWSQGTKVSVGGLGSGVLVSEDGKILTAAHVVQTVEDIWVDFPSGERVRARPVAAVQAADVALIQLERPPRGEHVVARVGDSDAVEVGDEIFIVGAPLGISHTLTVGHISARREMNLTMGGMFEAEFLQTDAAINTGNSGGPMFNRKGEVIGIVSHMISASGSYEGLGFAVSSNSARAVLLDRKAFWWGFDGYFLRDELAAAMNVPPPGVGVLVQRVAEGSPAAALGLEGGSFAASIGGDEILFGGDVIVKIMGVTLGNPGSKEKIQRLLDTMSPGQTLVVEVLRGGERLELRGELPAGTTDK